ncbi:hypothetical protein Pfo_008573 [Paulownia fortunei]|nr:hypothetical protein Pfo_008573 [Paulownia fortunei]
MAKPILQTKSASTFPRDRTLYVAAVGAILIFCALWTFTDPWPSFSSMLSKPNTKYCPKVPIDRTFYDDPETRYTIDKPMINWDEKRRDWFKHHPTFASGNGVLVVTGSQPSPCKNPFGDHLLLSGEHNPVYEGDSCWVGMERALNFADNQVLRNYGFVHPDLGHGSHVRPLPFDYQGA